MKQKIYVFGLVVSLMILTGAILKVNHWPAAGILLTLGLAILAIIFIPAALLNNYKSQEPGKNLSLYIVTGITCFVFFIAMLFKIMHWPFAGLLLTFAIPFPYVVFLPVFLTVTSRNRNFNIYNTVFVLFLLAMSSVLTSLLALNVSKTTIDDSYILSKNYTRLENVMMQLPESDTRSSINIKIDEVLKIVNDYEDRILKQEGLTRDQWNKNPGNLARPESRGLAGYVILKPASSYPGEELQVSIKNLIQEFERTPGYEELAKIAPLIFDYFEPGSKDDPWGQQIFAYNPLAWTLIYLDGLKANLSMLKMSGNKIN